MANEAPNYPIATRSVVQVKPLPCQGKKPRTVTVSHSFDEESSCTEQRAGLTLRKTDLQAFFQILLVDKLS